MTVFFFQNSYYQMSNLDWCFCGKMTIEGALYCSDRCYFDETGRSIHSDSKHTIHLHQHSVSVSLPTRIHSRSPVRQRPDTLTPSTSPMSQYYGSWGSHTQTGSIGDCFAALAFKGRRNQGSM